MSQSLPEHAEIASGIEADIKGSPADRRALARTFRGRRAPIRRIALIAAALAFGLTVTFGRDALYRATRLDYPLAATLAAIAALALFFAVQALFARMARPQLDDPRGAFLRGFRLRASDDGLWLAGENFEARYRWAGVLRMQETEDHAFLYTDGAQAIIVPKRCFASPDEAQRFVALVRAHVAG